MRTESLLALEWKLKWIGAWQTIGACHLLSSFFVSPGVKKKTGQKQRMLFAQKEVAPFPTSPVKGLPPAQVLGVFTSKNLMSSQYLSPSGWRALATVVGKCGAKIEEVQGVAEGLSEWARTLDDFDGFSPSTITNKLPDWIEKFRRRKVKQEKKFKDFRRNKV